MGTTTLVVMRGLALAHFLWGLCLLLLSAWLAIAAFLVLPHLSTGTVWSNLPGAMMLVVIQAGPVGALAGWMLVLGRWSWTGHGKLRIGLLVTHGLLLVPGAMALAIGVYAMEAAASSSARGGGLLSPIAVMPLAFGGCVCALAICSIAFALGLLPARSKRPSRC